MLQANLLAINNTDDKNKKNIGLVFETAVAYLSRESWQLCTEVAHVAPINLASIT